MTPASQTASTVNPPVCPHSFFFAGGGTGGHIYPALAVAQRLKDRIKDAKIAFFCSNRPVDLQILRKSGFEYLTINASSFSPRPDRLVKFLLAQAKAFFYARKILSPHRRQSIVIGTGGFVSAPVILAARSLKIPLVIINVDILPGRANRLLSALAEKIFVQFDQTVRCFAKHSRKTLAVGCPLRSDFFCPDPQKAIRQLALDPSKKILLITGASSGSRNINTAICKILPHLARFADGWQIVHLTGHANLDPVRTAAADSPLSYIPLAYYDDMSSILAAADIVIGRSGAVSIAEYARLAVPAVCIPYPYHRDRHQYLNAKVLADAGAAVIVDDAAADTGKTASGLLEKLLPLLADQDKRNAMSAAAAKLSRDDAADTIARWLSSYLAAGCNR